MKRLALGVLAELGLEAEDLLEELGRAAHLLAPLAEHLAEAVGARARPPPRPVHRDVAVALQQAHQRLDPLDGRELLGDGHQAEHPGVLQRAAAGPHLLGRPAQRLGQCAWGRR